MRNRPRTRSLATEVLLVLLVGGCQAMCEDLEKDPKQAATRDAKLNLYIADWCDGEEECKTEVVAVQKCVATVKVRARKHSEYGKDLGLWDTEYGISYDPIGKTWATREMVDSKEVQKKPAKKRGLFK